MVKGTQIILILLFSFLLLPFLSAESKVQVIVGTDVGINIRYPQFERVPVNTSFTLHTHVFNKTNGLALTNTTTDCLIHLYSPNGSHILKQNLIFEPTLDYELQINKGNFSKLGTHAYVIQCNNTNSGGAVSGLFEVTYSGKQMDTPQAILSSSFLLIFLLLFLLIFYIIGKLPEPNALDEKGEFVQRNWLKYLRSTLLFVEWMLLVLIFFTTSNLAFVYLQDALLANILFMFYKIFMALSFPIVVLWFIWIFSSIARDKEMKRYIEKGLLPHGKDY